jgi:hypothetical protein
LTLDGGDAAPPTTWHDITGSAFWSVFDTTSVAANAQGYFGGAFDGRYVYFVPNESHSVVARCDTEGDFTAAGSWESFDTSSLATTVGYRGGAFDGRYVYLVPFYDSATSTDNGFVARFDTQAMTFTDTASWATFNTSSVNAKAVGFDGAAFDGRYMYFVPHVNGTVARYDTQASFSTSSSWSTFDATTLSANAQGFLGAVFDGRYVYLVPETSGGHSILTRYDTQTAAFTATGSWAVLDLAIGDAGASFFGGGFDGQQLYFAPYPGNVAVSYNPAEGLGASSLTTFTLSGLSASAAGYGGAGFDGRYVYIAPFLSSVMARYDSKAAAFGTAASWSTYDLGADAGAHASYAGSVFDGQYMYFVPNANGMVERFDAKTPASMPTLPGWTGSFL